MRLKTRTDMLNLWRLWRLNSALYINYLTALFRNLQDICVTALGAYKPHLLVGSVQEGGL